MSKTEKILLIVIGLLALLIVCCIGAFITRSAVISLMPTATPVPGSISGVVTWETQGEGNKVVVGITVKVWDANRSRIIAKGVTDTTGKFEILNINPGKYTISAYQEQSTVGDTIAEKCWALDNIEVRPGINNQVFLDFKNGLQELGPYTEQCK